MIYKESKVCYNKVNSVHASTANHGRRHTMENNMNYAEEEKTIDLKQLLFFILKKWKTILIFLIIGMLLGTGIALLKGEKTLEDYTEEDIEELNTDKILQYYNTQVQYEVYKETEELSVLLKMDPMNAYTASRNFFISMPATDVDWIRMQYTQILSDVNILQEFVEASGLDCDQRTIKDLIGLGFSEIGASTWMGSMGFAPVNATVSINVLAPTEEVGLKLLNLLDEKVVQVHDQIAERYSTFTYERLSETSFEGYNSGVRSVQTDSMNTHVSYSTQIAELETVLTDDDMYYYLLTYEPEEIEFSMLRQIIKWAIVVGAVMCILAVGCYGVQFLLDDHIKTAHELHDYGLYTIAVLRVGDPQKEDFVDKLFAGSKLPTNSRAYLLNALQTLCSGKTVLSGDLKDAQTAEVMNWLAGQMDELCVTDKLACAEAGLATVKESDGAILFVRLWKTTAFDLRREMYVLRQIEKPVKGIVVLRG